MDDAKAKAKKDAYRAKEAEKAEERRRQRSEYRREVGLYRWAKAYDNLNGRPESDEDR